MAGNKQSALPGFIAALFFLTLAVGLWFLPRLAQAKELIVGAREAALDQEPALVMTMTVSLAAENACIGGESITALPTSTVHICYTVFNSGGVTFTNHIVGGNSFIPMVLERVLTPGDTITHTRSAQFAETTTQVDTWAANSGPGSTQVQAQDSVNVTVINPAVAANLTVGLDVNTCATTKLVTVPANATVAFCLTLKNTGDVTLTQHTIDIPLLAITGTVAFPLAPGQQQVIDNGNAAALGLPANFIRSAVAANLAPQAIVRSSTVEGFSTSDSSSAGVTVGTAATMLSVTINQAAPCGGATTLNPLRNSNIYFCLTLTNNGTVTLTNFSFSSATPAIQSSFVYTLGINSRMVVDNSFLTGIGAQPVLGPYQATTAINPTFFMTSTNANGFRVTSNNSVTISPVDPTATWTPTFTPFPPTPTFTPIPTFTFFPTFTPFPTSTPFPTFTETPTWTPTWTRSFELSNLATPTSAFVAAADQQAFVQSPEIDATNTAVALTLQADALATSQALAFPAATPPPSPLDTPTPEPTLDLLSVNVTQTNSPAPPTATPTDESTVTPSPTIRALTPPTPTALPNLPGLFSQVLGSAIATLGVLWFLVGSLVFFVVAGVIAGMSFRQSNRQRYELYALEEEELDEPEPPPAPRSKDDGDHWPTSLP